MTRVKPTIHKCIAKLDIKSYHVVRVNRTWHCWFLLIQSIDEMTAAASEASLSAASMTTGPV